MILTCNSCGKRFVVPDNAITASGRMVQCGSCGNKWKQYPETAIKRVQPVSRPQRVIQKPQSFKQKIQKTKKIKKSPLKKTREISLYSPEYLAKKHGIKINETRNEKPVNQNKIKRSSFGFYSSLLLFVFLFVSLSRIIYFAQDVIIAQLPISEFYLNYFFESIRNIFEIWKNLITY